MTQHRRAAALSITAPRTDIPKEYRLNDTDSEYLTIPHGTDINFARTDSFTVSAYIKFESSASGVNSFIASKRGASGAGWQFFKDTTDKLRLVVVGNGVQSATIIETYFTLPMQQWILCTVVYGGGPTNVKFYVNGMDGVTSVAANNLTSDAITNSLAITLGTRTNVPVTYVDMQFGKFMIHNRALTVNEIPDKMWNYGKPQTGNTVANCVRNYEFINDVFTSNYIVKGSISGANGASVNMSGVELVAMNSVMVPQVLGIQASPFTTTQNFIGWDSAGLNAKYDVEVSNDGSTGWVVIASSINALSYVHAVGVAATQRFYRVRAKGVGTVGTYSDVVEATTLDSAYADCTYYNTRRLGDNSYNYGLSVDLLRTAPQGYYDATSNKTYFVFMSRAEQGYSMATYIYYYDHASGTFSDPKYVGLKSRQGLDRHQIPSCIVATDGHILVSATDFHNGPLQIFRSDNPGSISSFTWITEIGVTCDYPEFRKFSNGDILIFCRYYDFPAIPDKAGLGVFVSTDDGLTWGAMVRVLEYDYSIGRPYPVLMPQTEAVDTVHILATPRNDTGGPFPADPDKVGYFKDYGYAYCNYVAEGLRFRNAGNSYSIDVVGSGFITSASWQSTFLYQDSVGTEECGQPTGIVVSGIPYIITYDDTGVHKCHYWNGSSWTHQTITWSDGIPPEPFTFGGHGVHALVHVTGTTFDIYAIKDGIVKWYRTTDNFANAVLQDANFLPDVDGLAYENGVTTWNIFQASEPFLFYSIKKSEPTPDPTSPGAWSDLVFKKLW